MARRRKNGHRATGIQAKKGMLYMVISKTVIQDGNKVKVGVRFRGRQMTHIEVGQEVMDKFIASLSEYCVVEKPSSMDGRWMIAILATKRK